MRITLLVGVVMFPFASSAFTAAPPDLPKFPPGFRCIRIIAGHAKTTNDMAFSPDGRMLVSTGDSQVKLWDVRTGNLLGERGWEYGSGIGIGFINGGKDIACAFNGTYPPCLLQVPSLRTRTELRAFPHFNFDDLVVNPDHNLIAGLESVRVSVWEAATGKRVLGKEFDPAGVRTDGVALHPAGKAVAVSFESVRPDTLRRVPDGTDAVRLYHIATGKELQRLSHPGSVSRRGPRFLAFTLDGRFLAGGYRATNMVSIWDLGSGKLVRTLTWEPQLAPQPWRQDVYSGISSLSMSPDGKTLAVMCSDLRLRLFEVLTGNLRVECVLHARKVLFSPDGQRLAALGYAHPLTEIHVIDWRVALPRVTTRLSEKELERLWSDLEGVDAAAGHRAITALAAAPAQATEMLGRRLRPVETVEQVTLTRLVAELDEDDFEKRKKAAQRLRHLGHQAEAILRSALTSPSLEVRKHVRATLKDLEKGGVTRRRMFRAVEVLELIATPEAYRILDKLSGGHGAAPETEDARRARQSLRCGISTRFR